MSLFLWFVLGTAATSQAEDLERHLRDVYENKTFIVRGFFTGDWLRYDSSGAPIGIANSGDINVAVPLGYGLDAKAVEAVQSWRFSPSQKNGHPVPVEIAVQVEFHLV